VWEQFDGLYVPPLSEVSKEARDIYKVGRQGRCMTCEAEVGKEALLIVTVQGINQLYCSHQCNKDMNVLGWLQQTYGDVADAVKFRGSAGHDG
jgi:hypothetical protein